MSLSSESFYYHLTPKGWVLGRQELDFGVKDAARPENCLLTVLEHRYRSSYFTDEDVTVREMWRSNNKAALEQAILEFGDKPQLAEAFRVSKK